MGQFRDRMDEELRIRGYSTSARECYVRCVRNFVRHFMRPPDQLTLEHIRQYQLHLTRERHVAWTYFNQVVCALRFFYREVLKTDWEVRHIPYQKTGRKLPEILTGGGHRPLPGDRQPQAPGAPHDHVLRRSARLGGHPPPGQ